MNTEQSLFSFTETEATFASTLNEKDRRLYMATKAKEGLLRGLSLRKVTKILKTSHRTLRRGLDELDGKIPLDTTRIRKPGGGRKKIVDKYPEISKVFLRVVESHMAGLPQNEDVVWLNLGYTSIAKLMEENGTPTSTYIVKQLLKKYKFRKRSFLKNLTLKYTKDRNEQFKIIEHLTKLFADAQLPIISVDTKKKEMLGNFKRDGKVLTTGVPVANDHDFLTFSDGIIVPHGIYDVQANMGYLTLGTSHDTSEFVCDNIERVWNSYLNDRYPEANTMVVLCDGGGSNSSSHKIVKQDLMKLATKLNKRIVMIHYPPYCSKYDPIEHRLFPHITRQWSGGPLLNIEDAAQRAREATTKTGLKVIVDINTKEYHIKRKLDDDFEKSLRMQVVHYERLPKYNYLIKPANC